jgi:predicted ribosome-associated RNA-binding protein Tma20
VDVRCGVGVHLYRYSVPVAVGKMAINTADVPKEGALKGKAVLTIHTFKDHLW